MTSPKLSVPRKCLFCSKEFYVYPYIVKLGEGKFCSRACCSKFNHLTHGKTKSRAFMSWSAMIQRCENPKAADFPRYGGAGVKISKEWRESFAVFFSDLGERPLGKTLDRIDGSLGYYKENCRWATPEEQNRNRKSNRLLVFLGETKCAKDWAHAVGLPTDTILKRLNNGWTIEETLTIPVQEFSLKMIRKKRLADILS
jgi:hypothetical protein